MTAEAIKALVGNQRAYFDTGATLPVAVRIDALKKLRTAVLQQEQAITEALKQDLGKSAYESYMCEVGMVLSEISYMLKHISRYTKNQKVPTPLAQFPSVSYRKPSPYGVVLVMSPWNYPFLLTLGPMVNALAAGNTVVVKPSAYAPATAALLQKLLEGIFKPEYVAVVTGGRAENACLLEEKFDYIFFTGSKNVGRLVLEKAAAHITPVTLELGGKSPCIVHESADIKLAARRIVFGKYLNCGQTCVAPDYVLCHESVRDAFVEAVKEEIVRQLGRIPLDNPNYGRMINKRHFDRVWNLIWKSVPPVGEGKESSAQADDSETKSVSKSVREKEKLQSKPIELIDRIVAGAGCDWENLQISPTVLCHVTWEDAIMQEEIFGPVLPILTFRDIDEVIETVNTHEKPLALYIFAEDKGVIKKVTSRCSFGGGCVNDVIIHLATSYMGFGGVGESGMGAYHGKTGFDTFTHYKSIVDKKTWLDLPMRYQPYKATYEKMLRFFLK